MDVGHWPCNLPCTLAVQSLLTYSNFNRVFQSCSHISYEDLHNFMNYVYVFDMVPMLWERHLGQKMYFSFEDSKRVGGQEYEKPHPPKSLGFAAEMRGLTTFLFNKMEEGSIHI